MKLRCITAVVGGVLATALSLHAQFVWTGTTSGSIEVATNWSPVPSPVTLLSNANVTFGSATNTSILLDATAINAAFGLPTMTVNNVSFTDGAANYSFSGTGSPTLVINGSVSTTVANPSPVIVNNSIAVVLGSGGLQTFNVASGSAIGILSDISGNLAGITKTGAGTLTLGGTNTYGGGTIVSAGTLQVSGSITHGPANLTVGNLSGDNGTLTLGSGGDITNQTGYIGFGTGSVGSVTVSGAGSTWTNSTYLYVGAQGAGTLTISNGGTVITPFASVGNNSGGTGTVSVDGSGSLLTNTNTLYVGAQGTGFVYITNGGDVASDSGSIGNNGGGSGTVSVSGAGSSWTNTNQLIVGDAAPGILIVNNGGSVSNTIGTISAATAATSTVRVTGANSIWTNTSSLNVGLTGIANLTIDTGGTVNVGSGEGTLTLGTNSTGNGTLNIGAQASGAAAAGGYLVANTITTGAGTGTVQFKTTATQASPYYFTSTGDAFGQSPFVTGGTSVVNTAGYNILQSTNTYAGGTTINGGTLVAGTSGAFGSGTITLNGGTLGTATEISVNNTIVFNSGRIGGNGFINSPISVGTNAIVSPGFSVGALTFGSGLTFATNGAFDFEVQTASGGPGGGWDLVSVSGGTLDITATTAAPFRIKVFSLTAGGAPGNVADFSSSSSYSWAIATSNAGITGFTNPNQIIIDATGFTNSLNGGIFTITQGNFFSTPALFLNFTPVPEPSTYALLAVGLGSLVLPALRRRQRRG